ncbi:MAG: hypothetical protein V4497_09425 [Bacteroidota bacterium]
MKTIIRTTIKGSENIYVKESVITIFESLQNKTAFMLLTNVAHNGTESQIIIKKSSIKMVKS